MKELLELLEKDASLSNETLAAMLALSPDAVAAQRRELEERNIIVKYQPIINWEKAGVDKVSAMIEVKITPQREVGFDCIAEHIYRYPEVRNVYLMSGAYDLSVLVEGNSLKEVATFVSLKLSTIDGVVSCTTHFLLKRYKEDGVILDDCESEDRLVVSP